MADIQQMAPVMSDADREVARTLRREKVSRVVRYVVLIFVGLLMLYPLAWMFSASFKPNHEIFTTLGLWPAHATWDGFINGWKTGTEYHFGHYMLNTFKYVIPKVPPPSWRTASHALRSRGRSSGSQRLSPPCCCRAPSC